MEFKFISKNSKFISNPTQYYDIKGDIVDVKPLERTNEIVEGNIKYIINDDHIPINQAQPSSESEGEKTKKKVKYSPAHLKAQNKYREKNRDKYNEAQRLLYEKKIQEEEWKQHYLERSRVNNKKYRDKKKQEKIESGEYVEKKRGRPRKGLGCIFENIVLETKDIKDEHTGHKVYSVSEYFSEENCVKITDEEKEKVNNMIMKIKNNIE